MLPEIEALERLGHEVWLVPMYPRGELLHADARPHLARTVSEPLFSGAIAAAAVRQLPVAPGHALSLLGRTAATRPRLAAKNLAVYPKALWLARQIRELGAEHVHAHWAAASATLAMTARRARRGSVEPHGAPLGHSRGEPAPHESSLRLLRTRDQRGRSKRAARPRRPRRLEPVAAPDGRRRSGDAGPGARPGAAENPHRSEPAARQGPPVSLRSPLGSGGGRARRCGRGSAAGRARGAGPRPAGDVPRRGLTSRAAGGPPRGPVGRGRPAERADR